MHRGDRACEHPPAEHLFLLRDKECERLMLVARVPERGAHLLDGIRRGKEFPPPRWLHAAADGRLLVLFACVLLRFRHHVDTTGGSIEEF